MTRPMFHVCENTDVLAQEAAHFVASLAKERVHQAGRFTIALSGGSTPRTLYKALASEPYAASIAWDRWHVFWGDERCVPPEHPDSNYRMAWESLLSHVPIPEQQSYRMRGEADPKEAAKDYEGVLRRAFPGQGLPSLDLILLGMGEDGHTASLFPGTAALEETQRLVVANWVPQMKTHRLTFTLPLINKARVVAFLVAGAPKAAPLHQAVEPSAGQAMPPAGLVRPQSRRLHWFVTADAAAGVTRAIA